MPIQSLASGFDGLLADRNRLVEIGRFDIPLAADFELTPQRLVFDPGVIEPAFGCDACPFDFLPRGPNRLAQADASLRDDSPGKRWNLFLVAAWAARPQAH